MHPVLVIGAGISGAACAGELARAGVPVRLLDRGRKPGGRMANRRLRGRPVDLGASYLTAGDDDFAALVERWRSAGLVRPWADTFLAVGPEGLEAAEPKTGPMRWGFPVGIRAVVEQMVEDLPVRQQTLVSEVTRRHRLLVDGTAASAVVLAMPDRQAASLLGVGLDGVRDQLVREWQPALALAAGWDERTWDFDGLFVNDDAALSWVADDGARRGDGAPVLVAHSTPEFAETHLAEPALSVPGMSGRLTDLVGLPQPTWVYVHRWSLSAPTGQRDAPYLLDDHREGRMVGVCGDGWGETSKVETAWRSGRDLGRELATRLT